MSELEDTLMHFGVKGMKWGQRKERSSSVTVTDRVGSKKRVKTQGGYDRRATVDAKKTATHKQVAKKNSTDALTNKQLQEAVKRMQLEKQFNELANPGKKKGVGAQYIEGKLKQEGDRQVAALITPRIAKMMAKFALAAAV